MVICPLYHCPCAFSTSRLVSERLQSLESSLSSQRQVQDSLQTSRAWLDNMHDQIKAADCPLGPSTQHAHDSLQQFEVRALLILTCTDVEWLGAAST